MLTAAGDAVTVAGGGSACSSGATTVVADVGSSIAGAGGGVSVCRVSTAADGVDCLLGAADGVGCRTPLSIESAFVFSLASSFH